MCSAQPCGNAPVRSEQSRLSVVKIPNPLGFFIYLVPVMHLAHIFHNWNLLKQKFKEGKTWPIHFVPVVNHFSVSLFIVG